VLEGQECGIRVLTQQLRQFGASFLRKMVFTIDDTFRETPSMSTPSRWPLAAASLLAGAIGSQLVLSQLVGQAQPVPLPAPQQMNPPAIANKELYSFREIAKRVIPAVVSIDAKSTNPKPAPARKLPPNLPEEYRRYFEQTPEEKKPDPNLGFGSGVLVDPSGVILTAFHVVEGADFVEITLNDGRKVTSKDIRRDPKTDLAIILIKTEMPLPFLQLADSSLMEVGDRVLAVGAPFGLTGSVSQGIVSAKSRQGLKLNQYEDFLQTDAAVNPGNSGGPLVNLDGQVIGINSAIKTRSGGFQGVGLAVSSNLARDVVQQLRTTGVVKRGFLGIGIREIDDALAQKLSIKKNSGVVVSKLYPDSSATKAGLLVGDIVLSVGGVPIPDLQTLPNTVAKLPLNQPTELQILRDGKVQSVQVQVVEQPEEVARTSNASPVPAAGNVRSGLAVADLSEAQATQMGYPRTTRGVIITNVERGSQAAALGLVRGQIIVKVDRTLTPSTKEFQAALNVADQDRGALLHVLKPNGEISYMVLQVRR
jgi:serine protease Do